MADPLNLLQVFNSRPNQLLSQQPPPPSKARELPKSAPPAAAVQKRGTKIGRRKRKKPPIKGRKPVGRSKKKALPKRKAVEEKTSARSKGKEEEGDDDEEAFMLSEEQEVDERDIVILYGGEQPVRKKQLRKQMKGPPVKKNKKKKRRRLLKVPELEQIEVLEEGDPVNRHEIARRFRKLPPHAPQTAAIIKIIQRDTRTLMKKKELSLYDMVHHVPLKTAIKIRAVIDTYGAPRVVPNPNAGRLMPQETRKFRHVRTPQLSGFTREGFLLDRFFALEIPSVRYSNSVFGGKPVGPYSVPLAHPSVLQYVGVIESERAMYGLMEDVSQLNSLSYLISTGARVANLGMLILQIATGMRFLSNLRPAVYHGAFSGDVLLAKEDYSAVVIAEYGWFERDEDFTVLEVTRQDLYAFYQLLLQLLPLSSDPPELYEGLCNFLASNSLTNWDEVLHCLCSNTDLQYPRAKLLGDSLMETAYMGEAMKLEKRRLSKAKRDSMGNNLLHMAVLSGNDLAAKRVALRCPELMLTRNVFRVHPLATCAAIGSSRLMRSMLQMLEPAVLEREAPMLITMAMYYGNVGREDEHKSSLASIMESLNEEQMENVFPHVQTALRETRFKCYVLWELRESMAMVRDEVTHLMLFRELFRAALRERDHARIEDEMRRVEFLQASSDNWLKDALSLGCGAKEIDMLLTADGVGWIGDELLEDQVLDDDTGEMVHFLLVRGCRSNDFFRLFDKCLENGVSLDVILQILEAHNEGGHLQGQVDNQLRSIMTVTVDNDRADVLQQLLEMNFQMLPNQYGLTPLHLSCAQGKDDCSRLLIESGRCNLDQSDKSGRTPLYMAAKRHLRDGSDLSIVKMLVRAPEVDIEKTILYAEQHNQQPVVDTIDLATVSIQQEDIRDGLE